METKTLTVSDLNSMSHDERRVALAAIENSNLEREKELELIKLERQKYENAEQTILVVEEENKRHAIERSKVRWERGTKIIEIAAWVVAGTVLVAGIVTCFFFVAPHYWDYQKHVIEIEAKSSVPSEGRKK